MEELLNKLRSYDKSGGFICSLSQEEKQILIQALEEKLNGKWIPVSQELPNNSRPVLVQVGVGGVSVAKFFKSGKNQVGFYLREMCVDIHINNVVAWRELPPRYKEA